MVFIKLKKNMKEYKFPKNWASEIYTHTPAILSMDEAKNSNVDETILYYYINSKGEKVNCNALYLREDHTVVVRNENGCQVCLLKEDLYIFKN